MKLLLIAALLILSACMHPRAIQAPEQIQLTPVKTISTLQARVLLGLSGVKGLSVTHAVDCYRMQYAGQSALLALPRGVAVGPVGHDPSMLAAAPLILAWLRELELTR